MSVPHGHAAFTPEGEVLPWTAYIALGLEEPEEDACARVWERLELEAQTGSHLPFTCAGWRREDFMDNGYTVGPVVLVGWREE